MHILYELTYACIIVIDIIWRLSDDVRNFTYQRMGEEGDFCDVLPTYP